jgi:hypothetical protein
MPIRRNKDTCASVTGMLRRDSFTMSSLVGIVKQLLRLAAATGANGSTHENG